jgi:hypothetical protein
VLALVALFVVLVLVLSWWSLKFEYFAVKKSVPLARDLIAKL